MWKVKRISIFLAVLLITMSMLSSFTLAANTFMAIEDLDIPSEDPIKTTIKHKFVINNAGDVEKSFSDRYLPNDWAIPDRTLLTIDHVIRPGLFNDGEPYFIKVEDVSSFTPESDKYFILPGVRKPSNSRNVFEAVTAIEKSSYDDFSSCEGQPSCLIAKGNFCLEEARITSGEFTNGVSRIEEFKLEKDTSCGDVSNIQLFSVFDSPRYTLPLGIGCEGYKLNVIKKSHGDWPNTGEFNFEDVEGGKKVRRYKDDNTFEVFLEENGKILQSINFLAQDFSGNSGGLAWEISCQTPLFADDEEEICKSKYGEDAWNPDIPGGNNCCETSDFGEFSRVEGVGLLCTETGWGEVTDCDLEYLAEEGLSVTALSPSACVGEVLREGAEGSEKEYLPTGNAWHQAIGLCEKIWVGSSVFLDVNPRGGRAAPPPPPGDMDNDGVPTAVDCNDNNPTVWDEITCLVPGEFTCTRDQFCLASCPALPQEHCFDSSDNDCNFLIDLEDPFCAGFNEGEGEGMPPPLVLFGTELVPLSEMGLNLITGRVAGPPNSCRCENNAVQGPGNCDPGNAPECTSENVCACTASEGGDGGESGDLGGSTRSEDVMYNYWAECPVSDTPPPAPKNHMDPEEVLGGGFNFNEPYPYDSPDRVLTDGVTFCTDGPSPSDTKKYYCAMNRTVSYANWVDDLDDKAYQTSCEAYNYTPTSSLCCGEPEDRNENYNDPGSPIGGCYNQEVVKNGEFLKDGDGNNNTKVIVDKGEFLGCKVTMEANPELFEICDTIKGEMLTRLKNECTVITDHYCSKRDGIWIRQEDRLAEDNVCTKRSMDDRHQGFCPGNLECFKSPTEGCVDSRYYDGDSYCYDGNWTTRTRLVAEKLLEIAGGEDKFKIQCDDTQTALLRIDPDQPTGNVPKFCSLRLEDDRVILGAAVNQGDIDGFISALHQSYKNAYFIGESPGIDDAFDFHECDASKKNFEEICLQTTGAQPNIYVYYHNETELVIITPEINIDGGFVEGLIEWLLSLFGIGEAGVQKLKDFDKMYLQSAEDGKEVRSFYQKRWDDDSEEQDYDTYITMEYVNFNPDFSAMISKLEAEEFVTGGDDVLIIKNPRPSPEAVWNTLINARI